MLLHENKRNCSESSIEKSYTKIASSIGIFGGVQVFNILISIIKIKLIALLIGIAGVGILGILNSTISLITSITNLGINYSGTRSISSNYINDKYYPINEINSVLSWSYVTGFIGSVIVIIFSGELSLIIFKESGYGWAFIVLSIVVLTQSITNSHQAILQGIRKIKILAVNNVAASFIGLAFSIPLFVFIGFDGIILSLGLSSIISLLFFTITYIRIFKLKQRSNLICTLKNGVKMIKNGVIIMITNLLLLIIMYSIQLYINQKGGMVEVGLYMASYVIVNSYLGLFLTSMIPDFLPRLSAVYQFEDKVSILVNQQNFILIYILGPVIIFLMTFLRYIIIILYDASFLGAQEIVRWSLLGVIFLANNWCSSIMIIAKNHFKTFFLLELVTDFIIITSAIILYEIYGLLGIGISFFVHNLMRFLYQNFLIQRKFHFKYNREVNHAIIIQQALVTVNFLAFYIINDSLYLFIGICVLAFSIIISFWKLKDKINLKDFFVQKVNNNLFN
jgi:O-antigen/teichoic acid export membrane protein